MLNKLLVVTNPDVPLNGINLKTYMVISVFPHCSMTRLFLCYTQYYDTVVSLYFKTSQFGQKRCF